MHPPQTALHPTRKFSVKKIAVALTYFAVLCYVRRASAAPSVIGTYSRVVLVLALLLLLLPFFSSGYRIALDAVFSVTIAIVSVLSLWLVMERCQQHGLSLTSGVGLFLFVSCASMCAGGAVGNVLNLFDEVGGLLTLPFCLVMVAVYILMAVLVVISRNRKEAFDLDIFRIDDVVNIRGNSAVEGDSSTSSGRGIEARLMTDYGLTVREAQVAVLFAQGRSASYAAQVLGITSNTVRGYGKNVYAKLGIHSKQELIDLLYT